MLTEWIEEKTVFAGDGAILYKDKLIEKLGDKAVFAEPVYSIPSPEIVAIIGEEKVREGFFISAKQLQPLYLRKSEAEIKFG